MLTDAAPEKRSKHTARAEDRNAGRLSVATVPHARDSAASFSAAFSGRCIYDSRVRGHAQESGGEPRLRNSRWLMANSRRTNSSFCILPSALPFIAAGVSIRRRFELPLSFAREQKEREDRRVD
jgi:hypothetical protein